MMGYFPNGTAGDMYQQQYCARCIHQDREDGCAVMLAHLIHNYDECNNPDSILHMLIPKSTDGVGNEQCRMFIDRLGQVAEAEVAERIGIGAALAAPSHDTAPYFVLINEAAAYCKTGDFFRSQGGLTEAWGDAWEPVMAGSLGEAQTIAIQWRRIRFPHAGPAMHADGRMEGDASTADTDRRFLDRLRQAGMPDDQVARCEATLAAQHKDTGQ